MVRIALNYGYSPFPTKNSRMIRQFATNFYQCTYFRKHKHPENYKFIVTLISFLFQFFIDFKIRIFIQIYVYGLFPCPYKLSFQ